MKLNLCNNCPIRRLNQENIELQRIEKFINESPMPAVYQYHLDPIIEMLKNRKIIYKNQIALINQENEKAEATNEKM